MDQDHYAAMEQAFFNDGMAIAKRYLSSVPAEDDFLHLCGHIYSYIDEFMDLFLNQVKAQHKRTDCLKGCAFCCNNAVFMLPHEAYYISHYITGTFTRQDKEEAINRVREKYRITKEMPARELLHYKHPCGLLRDNTCSIYPARPMACRIYWSTSVSSCEKELHQGNDLSVFLSLFELPLTLGRMINEGVCKVLVEYHLKPVEWTFEAHLLKCLDSLSIFDHWLTRGNSFHDRYLSEDELKYLQSVISGKWND